MRTNLSKNVLLTAVIIIIVMGIFITTIATMIQIMILYNHDRVTPIIIIIITVLV